MIEIKTRTERKFDALEQEGLRWCYGKKGSAPPPPDYQAAAVASGEASKEVTEQQTWANRPDQYTPWGSTTWQNRQVWDPATRQYINRWTQNTNLNQDSQAALDAQLALQRNKSELGAGMYERMEDEYGTPMDWGQFTDMGGLLQGGDEARQAAEDALYGRATSRLDPMWEQREDQAMAKLVAQGLRPGDPAYDQAMENMSRERNDAYQQAMYGAITGGGQEATRQQAMDKQASAYQNQIRQQEMAEEMQKRGFSLNEINAIISGQQVGMPSMPNFSQANAAQPTDYLGATDMGYQAQLGKYSADQAADQGFMSGLGSIANVGASLMMSDRRLKENVKRIGEACGLPLYVFTYVWGEDSVGFMADEVKDKYPEAVFKHDSGYDMVDYNIVLTASEVH